MEPIRRTLFMVPSESSEEMRAAVGAFWQSLLAGSDDMLDREDALRAALVQGRVPSQPLSWATFEGWLNLREGDDAVRIVLDETLCIPRDVLLEIARRAASDADSKAVVSWLETLPQDASVVSLGESVDV